MYARSDKGKLGKNQSTSRTEARDKAENKNACVRSPPSIHEYIHHVHIYMYMYHRYYHIVYFLCFITAARHFRVARGCSNPYVVLFRSFVCQIFIKRFGVATNERNEIGDCEKRKKKKWEEEKHRQPITIVSSMIG